jgi:hypothetical protein
MIAIIEFLFANPFILIILIGLIYTMFFRKSPAEKKPGNRPPTRPVGQPGSRPPAWPAGQPGNRMPNFGGSPMMPPKPVRKVPVFQEPPRHVQPQPPFLEMSGDPETGSRMPAEKQPVVTAIPAYELPNSPLNPAYEQMGSQAAEEKTDPVNKPTTDAASPVSPAVSKGTGPMIVPALLTKDDLTRAIIWSEILGPPRAKRPFRR